MVPKRLSATSISLRTVGTALLALAAFSSPAALSASDLANLVPINSATHTAVQSGDWSDPQVWSGSALPTAGARVHVPAGTAVTYNQSSTNAIDWVRLDGTLSFAPQQSTLLTVDTLAVMPGGALLLGQRYSRIEGNQTARIVFTDSGPISRTKDPKLLSRGLIAMGRFEAWGERKASYSRVDSNPMTGATSIVLEEEPVNWKVGDSIVVAGTHYLGWELNGTEDEVREILAINGRTLTVDPLNFDHDAPAQDLRTYVGNLSRNVRFEGQGGAATPTQQRPHIMVMHHLDANINHAGFYDLGRTDKSIPLDDVGENPDGSVGNGNNPRGRYPMHFHLGGADSKMSQPGIVRGSAVWGSPGWGIAVHDAHALIEDNVSYNVLGAHFVTEIGNELGAFRRNLAIFSKGAGSNDGRGLKENVFTHDFGHEGHGFWFQGRNIVTEDLIASGTTGPAIIWFHRSEVERPRTAPENLLKPFDYRRLRDDFTVDDIPIVHAKRLEAFGSSEGLRVIKANPNQGHDMRSQFEDILAWNVPRGMKIEYTRHYTFKNVRLHGTHPDNVWRTGLDFGNRTRDMVVENLFVKGFGIGVHFGTEFNGSPDIPDVTLIDPVLENVNVEEYRNFNPSYQQILSAAQVGPSGASFVPGAPESFDLPPLLDWRPENTFSLEGRKYDSIGEGDFHYPADNFWSGYDIISLLREGYYTRPDGSRYLPLHEMVADRLTGEYFRHDFEVNVVHDYNYLGDDLGAYPGPPANLPPTFQFPAVQTAVSEPLIVSAPGLLAQASDPDSDAVSVYVTGVAQPSNGWVSVNANGSFEYFPNAGFTGQDSFEVNVTDGHHISSPVTVNITVSGSSVSLFSSGFEIGNSSLWSATAF